MDLLHTPRAGWSNVIRSIGIVLFDLETLDLTAAAGSILTDCEWLRHGSPLDSLRLFTKLKSLRIFQEAMYKHSTRVQNAPKTILPPNLEHLCIRRPTFSGLDTIIKTLKHDPESLRRLREITLHYEPGKKLPTPRALYESSQRRDLHDLGIAVPICWSVHDDSDVGLVEEVRKRLKERNQGIMYVE